MSLNNTVEILHIEDNPLDAFLIKNFLEEPPKDIKSAIHHYNVTNMMTLKDGIQSLENLENNFQIILLDLNLPDGSGTNNIKTIREINSNIPIVIVTSVQDEKIAMDALRHGAQECLVKEQGNGDLIKRIIQSSIFRKKVEIELAKKAYYDDLTSLPNRLFFENAALNMIRHAKRWNRRDALMFIDLNKFKIINDTHGHEAGNIVLKEIAERLRHTLRDSDLIARYAGDEFVVYMDCGRADITEELCIKVAEKIIKSVEHPIKIGDIDVEISLSIGIALYPDAGKTFEILLKNADQAMYKAKKSATKKYQIITDGTPTLTKAKKQVKDTQKIFQSNSELADFSNSIAHDLKAQMKRIMSYCELLNNDETVKTNTKFKFYIGRMSISTMRMQSLIEGLLSYAETSHFHEERKMHNLKTITEKVVQNLDTFTKKHNAQIIVNDMPEWPIYRVKFEQIIFNMITNGIKYSLKDRPPIVKISGYISDTNRFHINIEDNGQGIATKYKHKILKPFQRLHRADDIEGSGLGLAVCTKAIEKHGGKLVIHSIEGQGTTMEVILTQ